MTENWKEIPGHEGRYLVSDFGNVKSLRTNKQLKPHTNPGGYHIVTLYRGECKTSTLTVHSIVLTAFVGPRPKGYDAAHLDGCRTNNALVNLKWATRKENHAHKMLHGTRQIGERNGFSKLTPIDIIRIRDMWKIGIPKKAIARAIGISDTHVRQILKGMWWQHVPDTAARSSAGAEEGEER